MTNPLRNIGKAVNSVVIHLPVFSVYNYMNTEFPNETNKSKGILKAAGHTLYGIVGGSVLLLGALSCYATGEVNPITARQVILRRIELSEAKEQVQLQRYDALYDKLFGENGLADQNHNGQVDIYERVEAVRRMGLEAEISLPQPKIDDLERAVKSYQAK